MIGNTEPRRLVEKITIYQCALNSMKFKVINNYINARQTVGTKMSVTTMTKASNLVP